LFESGQVRNVGGIHSLQSMPRQKEKTHCDALYEIIRKCYRTKSNQYSNLLTKDACKRYIYEKNGHTLINLKNRYQGSTHVSDGLIVIHLRPRPPLAIKAWKLLHGCYTTARSSINEPATQRRH